MIKTEGFRYAGSKNKIIPHIISIIENYIPENLSLILDGFSGTTRVSQALKYKKYTVISNDINIWSNIFGKCYLLNKKSKNYYKDMIEYLNNLNGYEGWFSKNYGGLNKNGLSIGLYDKKKKPWQLHNTLKLDAIRSEIDRMNINEIEKSVLLTSLILALDKVDNTLGHQVSYLKKWSPRSFNTLQMKVPNFIVDDLNHKVFNQDIFNLIDITKKCDLCYYDPPYGSNNNITPTTRVRYNSYYHLLKTIILNDEPELFGSSNRRLDSKDSCGISIFEEYKKENNIFIAEKAIENLIIKTKSKYIILSYNNNGRVSIKNIIEIIRSNNLYLSLFSFNYKENSMAIMNFNNKWNNKERKKNKEFLFLISKEKIKSKLNSFFN